VQPELIVSLDTFAEALLESDVAAGYVRIREPIYTDEDLARARSWGLWGSRFMNVLVRRDLLPGAHNGSSETLRNL
jgi:hypothetical protein